MFVMFYTFCTMLAGLDLEKNIWSCGEEKRSVPKTVDRIISRERNSNSMNKREDLSAERTTAAGCVLPWCILYNIIILLPVLCCDI